MRFIIIIILLLFSTYVSSQISSTLRRTQDELLSLYPEGTVSCLPDGSLTEIVDVVNPTTGQIWMDRNLGAQRAATSSNDALAYGDLYQWGRFSDGHQCRNSSTTTTNATTYLANDPSTAWYGRFITEGTSPYDWLSLQNDDLWKGNEGVNNPCPNGYRVPTESELNNERLSWSSNDAAGAFGSPLKLTVSGYRGFNGSIFVEGVYGYIWSSNTFDIFGRDLRFTNTDVTFRSDWRSNAMSIRCIKDIPQDYQPNTVHCADTAVVNTVVSETGRVWMDRNLGAAQVATAYNDANSYGDLYQWGRFAEGHQCRNSLTTTTLATTAEPSLGNSWDGKFILNGSTSPYNWLSTQDDDIWQVGTEINNPCPPNFRLPTEYEWQAEINTWSSLDRSGAFASNLKLPAAGYRYNSSGVLILVGSSGYYWSFSVNGSPSRFLNFNSSNVSLPSYFRALGTSVRCIQKLQPSYPKNTVFCNNVKTEVVDVVSETGKVWMDRNLGASRVAQAYNDSESYGDLYQWGRFADGHQCRDSDTTSINATTAEPFLGNTWDGKFILEPNSPYDWLVPQDDNLWQGVNGVNNPCPNGYRIPTASEWQAEDDTFSPNNRSGAFASNLKLPSAGYRGYSDGSLRNIGTLGVYWASSVNSNVSRSLLFNSSVVGLTNYARAEGVSVRCIKD